MKETRPKVLALYRGVLELLDEGADVNGIKVSDITARAGIGKGTAYDYFKSREEIIACALLYDVEQKIEEEKEELDRHEGFRGKRTQWNDFGRTSEAKEVRVRTGENFVGNVPGGKGERRDPGGHPRLRCMHHVPGEYGSLCYVSGEG